MFGGAVESQAQRSKFSKSPMNLFLEHYSVEISFFERRSCLVKDFFFILHISSCYYTSPQLYKHRRIFFILHILSCYYTSLHLYKHPYHPQKPKTKLSYLNISHLAIVLQPNSTNIVSSAKALNKIEFYSFNSIRTQEGAHNGEYRITAPT